MKLCTEECVVTNSVTTELVRSFFMKPTVSFMKINTGKIIVSQGKHGGFDLGENLATMDFSRFCQLLCPL